MRRIPLCALLLLAACGKLDPPRVARLELRRPDERIDAKEDVRRSRAESSRMAALDLGPWSRPSQPSGMPEASSAALVWASAATLLPMV